MAEKTDLVWSAPASPPAWSFVTFFFFTSSNAVNLHFYFFFTTHNEPFCFCFLPCCCLCAGHGSSLPILLPVLPLPPSTACQYPAPLSGFSSSAPCSVECDLSSPGSYLSTPWHLINLLLCASVSHLKRKSESSSIIPNSEGFSSSLLDSSALAHVQQWEPRVHCECAICVYTVVTVGYTRKPLFGHSDSKGYFCLPSVPFVAIHPRTSNTCCSANLAQCTAQNYKYPVNIYWVNKREKREVL